MGYRKQAIELYGDRCLHCGTTEQVKVHHMDGDHDHDRKDNWVPLCQECHVGLHKGAPPYTIWLALGQPVIDALDELRAARGYRSRSEAIAQLLQEAGGDALEGDTWALLANYNSGMYTGTRAGDRREDRR